MEITNKEKKIKLVSIELIEEKLNKAKELWEKLIREYNKKNSKLK